MNTIQEMTELTRYMFEKATTRQLDLQEAVKQLKENAHTRSVRDVLANITGFAPNESKAMLTYLVEQLANTIPNANRASLERKVRIWMKDDTFTISKQGAIQLGFALNLSVHETDVLLTKVCGEGFHWRDPEEIVYIYALLNGLSYLEACVLYDHMAQEGLFKKHTENDSMVYTDQVRNKILEITNNKELEDYLRSAQNDLGRLHNTAYSLFTEFLNLLKLPVMSDNLPDISKFSIDDVLTNYLHQDFIPRMRRANKGKKDTEKLVMSALQRDICENWPDETTLSKMVHRQTDVTRKVLILLFLATDGGDSDYGDDYIDEQTSDDVFQDMYERLNSMLNDCGFSLLDPRTSFDWMILYCMCADESIFIDGRVQRFLSEIFPNTGMSSELADHSTS